MEKIWKVISVIFVLILLSFNIYGNNFSNLEKTLFDKGIDNLNENELIDYSLYSEMQLKDTYLLNLDVLKRARSPLNLEFMLLYVMESYEYPKYKLELKDILNEHLKNSKNIVFKIDMQYALSLLDKLDLLTFKSSEYGYLGNYYIVGPFVKNGILDFDNPLPFEKKCNIKKEYKTFFGKQIPYKISASASGWLNIDSIYKDKMGVSYYIASERVEKSGIYYLHFITNKESKLFLDGKKIFSIKEEDYSKPQKNIFKVNLKQGDHIFMVKLENDSNLQGFYLEPSTNGFMIQLFNETGEPVLYKEGNYSKGTSTLIEHIDIQGFFKNEDIYRKNFKLANILMSYGYSSGSYSLMKGLLKNNNSPIYNFFMGYLIERFPQLGFANYAYNYYFKSINNWADNYIGRSFIGKKFLDDGKLEVAGKYILPLYEKFPMDQNTALTTAHFRNKEGLTFLGQKIMQKYLKNYKSDLSGLELYSIFKNSYGIDKINIIKDCYKKGIITSDILLTLSNYYIENKEYDNYISLLKSIKNQDLRYNILLGSLGDRKLEKYATVSSMLKNILSTYPQNSDLYSLMASFYLDNNDYPSYKMITNKILKRFGNFNDEVEFNKFAIPDYYKYGNLGDIDKSIPLTFLSIKQRITFFNDLSYRKFNHIVIYVANQAGVDGLSSFKAPSNTYFMRIINPDGKEYFFHNDSIKGLQIGSILEIAFAQYGSRSFENINSVFINPIIFKNSYPVRSINVIFDIPKKMGFKNQVLKRNDGVIINKKNIQPFDNGYKSYLYSSSNIKYFKPEKGLPMEYCFLSSVNTQVPMKANVFLTNYYKEIFTDSYISSNVKGFFDSFKGTTRRDKMLSLYDFLETKFVDDSGEGNTRSIWNIISTKRGDNIDKLRIFKLALEYWKIPHRFLIYSNYAHVDTKYFSKSAITGSGILTDINSDTPVLSTFSKEFIPYGGEKQMLRKTYIYENSTKMIVKRNFKVGIETGLKIKSQWDMLQSNKFHAKISFLGDYASYKNYFFDKKTSDKAATSFISNIFPYVKLINYKVIVKNDNKPFYIIIDGFYNKKMDDKFILPFTPSSLSQIFGGREDRKFPLYIMDYSEMSEICEVMPSVDIKNIMDFKVKSKGISYNFSIKKNGASYVYTKQYSVSNAYYNVKKFKKYFKKAKEIDNYETTFFKLQ